MDIYAIRAAAKREEIDYPFLMHTLAKYRCPRNKIQAFLRSQDLIRIKKGIYIFGKKAKQEPYSKEVLANLIYGPSAISLEYALSHYGLIPERVETVTCITNNRYKHFDTPVGHFEYTFLSSEKYAYGITQIEISPTKHFLIAIKEKAIADMLMLRTEILSSEDEVFTHLIENLRIDELELKKLDYKTISILANLYKNKNVYFLQRILEKNHG
jgi:predicted transcriptional regulator of viral defense system